MARRNPANLAEPRPPTRPVAPPNAKHDPRPPEDARGLADTSAVVPRARGVFAPFEHGEFQQLAALAKIVTFDANATVIRKGDRADHLFIVRDGAVRVSRLLVDGRRTITGFLFPGELLGLSFLCAERTACYAYTAEAIAPTTLWRFPRLDMERLLESMPHVEKRLLGIAANELRAAQDQMLLLARKTARKRLASFLVMLSLRAQRHGRAPAPFTCP